MTKFDFQKNAIEELCQVFKTLWHAPGNRLPLVFKAPTGSGKTFMVTSFINDLTAVENFDEDIAWIWITFSDELAMQSRDKFNEYFFPNSGRRFLTVADFDEGKLRKNDVLFLNWQKLVATNAKDRVLRRPTDGTPVKESGYYFEDLVEATHAAGRKIAMIIDESHTHVSQLAEQNVINPADPKVIVHVSATPKWEPSVSDTRHSRAGFVEVERQDVVDAGLIKEAIISQTEEELANGSAENDTDARLLDLAMRKREAVAATWGKAGCKVNPLVLIQLPNDDNELAKQNVPTKESVVMSYLSSKGVLKEKVACWFDGRRENMDGISDNDNPVEYMLFKCAAGTGWDCPRAQVMVMFREIKAPTFKTQTLGRILRNPVPRTDLSKWTDLRLGYLYTNYARNQVETEVPKSSLSVLTRHSKLIPALCKEIKEGQAGYVVHEKMLTEFMSRADYGDLGKASSFQVSFVKSMDSFFGLTDDDLMSARSAKVSAKGVELSVQLTSRMIANVEWRSNSPVGVEGGTNVDKEISSNDVEKLFTLASIELLKEQSDVEAKVSNIARSAGVFRAALRMWLELALPDVGIEVDRYRIALNDLTRGAASVLRAAITEALKEYAPIKRKFVAARRQREEERDPELFCLKREYSFSEKYQEYGDAKLCAVQPFYLPENYNGRENETEFIAYLEQQGAKIDWWFKNGNEGMDYFSLKYLNETDGEKRLFYPDWIVKFKDGRIGIFDTKSGNTAANPEGREKGLNERIGAMNEAAGGEVFVGGLVVKENGRWYCNDGATYRYARGHLDGGWKKLVDLM